MQHHFVHIYILYVPTCAVQQELLIADHHNFTVSTNEQCKLRTPPMN